MIGDFEKKFKIDDMIAFIDENNNKITIKDIYNSYNLQKEEIKKKFEVEPNSQYVLKITSKIKVVIDGAPQELMIIKLNNSLEINLLKEPVRLKLIYLNQTIETDLVSTRQYNYIREKYKNPLFYCKTCSYKSSSTIFDFSRHNHHDIYIMEDEKIEIIDINNFDDFFKKFDKKKPREFETILEFDKNADIYFNKFKKIDLKKKFIFIPNIPLRIELMEFLESSAKEEKNNMIYSLSGIGKSFSAIYQLKYCFDLTQYGTLYLHCKFLAKSMDNFDFKSIKKVLIDEIIFLFRNNQDMYNKACNLIKGFIFTMEKDYIDLIKELFLLLDNKKIYIIVFDQYRKKYDTKNKINNIINFFSMRKNFKFTKIMSMNDEDVKEFKITSLLNGVSLDISTNSIIKEIVAVDYNPFENNPDYNLVLNQIGKNIKNYNELNNIIENSTEENKDDNIKEYLNSKKGQIKKKILEFFDISDEKIYNMNKLLMISVDHEYDKKGILDSYKIIPFKYFDIIKEDNHYKIKYCYECIPEIIKELLGELFEKDNSFFINLMNSAEIKEGNKGYIFEQMVVDFFSPKNNNFFYRIKDLTIFDSFQIPKFIPRKNEVNIPLLDKKITLKKTNYLIKQKIFGGKNVDFALLYNIGDEPLLFVFQVSILKRIIFTKEYLTKQLNTLINYIKNFIENLNINAGNVFFGYIFSTIKSDSNEFKNMINNCKNQDLSFCFYDYTKKAFFDKEQKYILSNIKDMISWPFIINPTIYKKFENSNKKFFPSSTKNPFCPLTKFEEIKILSIVRYYIEPKISLLTYHNTGNYNQTSKSNLIYYARLKSIVPSKKAPSFLLFSYSNSTYVFDLNLTKTKLKINNSIYDIYSIV